MDAIGINIDNKSAGKAVEALDAVAAFLERAMGAHMDQETIRHALDVAGQFGKSGPTTISGCVVTMGVDDAKSEPEEPEEESVGSGLGPFDIEDYGEGY